MSQSFSQNPLPACVQCGSTDYILESGYYFCMECQVQSQDIREEVYDDFVGGQFKGAKTTVPHLKSQDKVPDQSILAGKEFTSWEALNVILHGLVRELNLLGAPKELKVVTLQLWACYLMKNEAAFISKSIEKRPRLGLTFRRRDAELVYGTDYDIIKSQKRPVTRKKRHFSPSKSEQSVSSLSTGRSGKIRLTLKKKKLASAEYAASTSQSSAQSELTLENLSSRSLSEVSQKSLRLQYTKDSKSSLFNLLDTASMVVSEDRAYLQRRLLNKHSKSLEHVTIKKLVAILRIALLYLNSDIHLGDLLRMSQEGYLSLLNAEKLIPSNVSLNKDLKLIFIPTLNSRETINKSVLKIANFLGINGLKTRILPLIRRYLVELSLPSELYSLINCLIGLKPPQLVLNSVIIYEARALALIVFILKYLFGLDGVTERKISKVAKIVNKNEDNNSPKLFDFCAWMHFINCRNSVISYYHQGTKDFYFPTSRFGGANVFLSEWDKIPAKQTLPREHIIDFNLSECLRRFMKEFSKKPSEPLSPTLQSHASMIEHILKTKNLPCKTRIILQHNFAEDTIQFLLDPKRQKYICEKYDLSIEYKLSANFTVVKALTGVANNSKVNPFLNAKKKVNIKIKEYQEKGEKLRTLIMLQKKKLENKRNIFCNVDKLLEGELLTNEIDSKIKKECWSGVGRGYWTYHSSVASKDVQCETFSQLSEVVFHPDFLWLLKEVSRAKFLQAIFSSFGFTQSILSEYIYNKNLYLLRF